VDKGTLVEFRLQGDRRLAVLERPDGKARWFAVDERGQSHSLAPGRLPMKSRSKLQTVGDSQLLEEVNPISTLRAWVAWELLVEEGETVNPSQMATLLFSAQSPPKVTPLTTCWKITLF